MAKRREVWDRVEIREMAEADLRRLDARARRVGLTLPGYCRVVLTDHARDGHATVNVTVEK